MSLKHPNYAALGCQYATLPDTAEGYTLRITFSEVRPQGWRGDETPIDFDRKFVAPPRAIHWMFFDKDTADHSVDYEVDPQWLESVTPKGYMVSMICLNESGKIIGEKTMWDETN